MSPAAGGRPARLRGLLEPSTTAVLTMELQQGVVGPDALFPMLVEQVEAANLLDTVGGLCRGARQAGVRVVHCTHLTRPDGAGQAINSKVFALNERLRLERGEGPTQIGSPGAELVPQLAGDPRDIEVPRFHGMTPFTSTALDQTLRNLGVRTVVATGVSVNLGIFGMSMTALDLGYQVVIPRNAVVGVPREYADAILDNSLSLIATIVTTTEVLDTWRS